MRVVVSLLEHLGDIIAAEPIARHLKANGHRVTWCVMDKYKDLVTGNPAIDEVKVLNCLTEWEDMPYEKMWDVVVDLHFDNRLCHVTGRAVRKRVGDLSVNLHNYLDYGSLLEAFCAGANIARLTDAPQLHVPLGEHPMGGKPYAALHCTANEVMREWRDYSWRMLAYDLVAEGLPVVEVGGRPILEGVRGVIDKTGILPVPELVQLVGHSSLFVGCESGPAHIANILKTPSVIVSGSYRTWKRYNVWTGHLRDNARGSVISLGTPVQDVPYALVRSMVLGKALPFTGDRAK